MYGHLIAYNMLQYSKHQIVDITKIYLLTPTYYTHFFVKPFV